MKKADDNDPGFKKTPDRYMTRGRETIDRMRDLCHYIAEMSCAGEAATEMADTIFAAHCTLTSLKYFDRAREKGSAEDAAKDRKKGLWYAMMANHVAGGCDDPRSGRKGFALYARQPWEGEE